jgi:hypothetical protein
MMTRNATRYRRARSKNCKGTVAVRIYKTPRLRQGALENVRMKLTRSVMSACSFGMIFVANSGR